MAKLNLKEIDFKRFLMEKGERLALWLTVGIMALLIIFGVFINGFSRGSASGNSSEMLKLCDAGNAALKRSAPSEAEKVIPEEFKKAATLAQINELLIACLNPLFTIDTGVDRRWRKPDVLSPDEFQVMLMRELVKTYIPGTKNGKPAVMVIKKKDVKTKPGGPGGPNPMMGRGPMLNNMQRMYGMMGGGMMNPNFGNFNPMMMPKGAMPGMGAAAQQDDDSNITLELVPIEDLGKETGKDALKPAEAVVPLRIVSVQFAFPLRKQYEVFQRALRFESIEAMEKDASVEFTGINVQRREIGPDGKPGEWKDVDLIGPKSPLRPFLAFGNEPEDPALIAYGLAWPKDRLLIPRPFLARDRQWPAYTDLPSVLKTFKDIEEAAKAGQPPPPPKMPSRFGKEFDIFGDDAAGNPDPKVGPGGPPMPPPVAPKGPKGPMAPPLGARAQAAFGDAERLLPQKCLGRFIDVQVAPGTTYEYRVQVRMANPLFGKADSAIAKDLTKDKEIVGEWAEVKDASLPSETKVRVPPEGDFYFVEDTQKSRTVSFSPDRVWTQVHRWFDWVPVNPAAPRESMTAVGEWAAAEQSAAFRGEYLGRWEDVELPIWNPKLETFVMAQHPEHYRRGKPGTRRIVEHKGPAIDFTTGSILVDFDGGKSDLLYRGKDAREVKIKDESAIEALVMTPDGRLIVRDARKDDANEERTRRLKEISEWVKAVKDRATGKGGKGDGDFFKTNKP
ncbi:hypothetical protein AYO40_04315 [Planctomycetaceae bacterium SCGC AG-212-D15]|nr:hypothetical protein AYO40_04315 [Planctomycetaceae bacterium SCGC AG-212-D15]